MLVVSRRRTRQATDDERPRLRLKPGHFLPQHNHRSQRRSLTEPRGAVLHFAPPLLTTLGRRRSECSRSRSCWHRLLGHAEVGRSPCRYGATPRCVRRRRRPWCCWPHTSRRSPRRASGPNNRRQARGSTPRCHQAAVVDACQPVSRQRPVDGHVPARYHMDGARLPSRC